MYVNVYPRSYVMQISFPRIYFNLRRRDEIIRKAN